MKYLKMLLFLFCAVLTGCLLKVPKYPYFKNEDINTEAIALSNRLEKYIKDWHQGKCPGILPDSVLPKGYDYSKYKNIRLVKYEDIRTEEQWAFRPAHTINFEKLYGSFPDPNCSYLLAPVLYAPFGSQLHIEGEYPYCRFFSIQASSSFDPSEYRYDKWSGKGEIGIVDSDIRPQQGSTNPFLPNGTGCHPIENTR